MMKTVFAFMVFCHSRRSRFILTLFRYQGGSLRFYYGSYIVERKMGDNYGMKAVVLLVLTLSLYLVITLSNAHPVQNQNTLKTKATQHSPEVGKKDGVARIHRMSKRFARPDTSGVFLNHFPVTNLLSTPDKTHRQEASERQNSVLNKAAFGSSAFRKTPRVIESNPTPTESMRNHNPQQRGKKGDSLPNVIYKNSSIRKRLDNHETRDNERKDKVQAWKDLSDKLMGSWSYQDSETTTSGGVIYVHRTPSLTITTESLNNPALHAINYMANEKHRTTPVLRESVQHGPAIVRTRVPNTRQTMIGYAETFTTPVSNQNDKLNGGYVTEPSVFNTNTPSTTAVYQIKRPKIKTDSIDRKATPNTGRDVAGRYDIAPHKYDESVYHMPSQVHTRTLVTKSWKTTEHGRPNVSIAVSDTEYSDYALANNTSEPRGYVIPLSQWSDTHNTRAPERVNTRAYDQDTQINNITDIFLESLNSKIGLVTRGDTHDTSTVETRFVDTTPKQKAMVTLQSGTSEQNSNSDIYFTSTNEYLLSESTPKEDRTLSSVGDATELTSKSNLSPASTVAYQIDTSTPNYEQMTSASTGAYHIDTSTPNYELMTSATGDTIDHNSVSIETSRSGQNDHTTPVYTTVDNEGTPSTINLIVNQTRDHIESDSTTVSKAQLSTTATQTPVSFTKPLLPKKTPTKMKVYDIKEIVQGELKSKVQAEKDRKPTPMKVFDITDPVMNEAKVPSPKMKGHKLDRKNDQDRQSKHNTKIEELILKTKSSEAYTGQHLIKDRLKVQKSSNNTNNNSNSRKTIIAVTENITSNGEPAVLGQDYMLGVQDRAVLTKSQNQKKDLKSTKYHEKRLVINGKVSGKKSVGNEPEPTERRASAKWNEINAHDTNTNDVDWPSKQQQQQQQTLEKTKSVFDKVASSDMTNTNQTQDDGNDVTVHHHNSSTCNDSDTHQITRAISVIKKLLDKIQVKPIVKALPRPNRQRYLLIPLGNLTFTEIKQKLLAYQTHMQEFQNDQWSDNSLVNDVNTDKERPIVLDHRPTQR